MNSCYYCENDKSFEKDLDFGQYTYLSIGKDQMGLYIKAYAHGDIAIYYLDYCPFCGKEIKQKKTNKNF